MISETEYVKEWHPKNQSSPQNTSYGSGKPVWWICQYGHEWEASPNRRTSRKTGCPVCTGKRVEAGFNDLATTHPDFAAQWSTENDKLATEVSKGSKYKAKWLCAAGHTTISTVSSKINYNIKCPICTSRKIVAGVNDLATKRPDLAAELVNPEQGTHLAVSSGKRLQWRCKEGHEWEATPNGRTYHRSPTGCPECNAPGEEKSLNDYISSIYAGDVIRHDRKIIKPYEVDIYLPERKLAIEYNGVFWHSQKFIKDKMYHQKKLRLLNEAGVSMIAVWDDDWRSRPEVVKKMLDAKINGRPAIGARHFFAKHTTYEESSAFLNENHIQGARSGTHYIGLFRKDTNELCAVGVFVKHKHSVDVARYSSSVAISGGLRKMMSFLPYERFHTFADLSVSNGSMYSSSGWEADGYLNPDYQYVVGGNHRRHKFLYRKDRFKSDVNLKFDPDFTEAQLAELNGLHRIYDYGKIRYRFVK